MATAVKVKNEESQGNAITGAAVGIGQKVTGTVHDTREFLHDVRVEMRQVNWPSRLDVWSTTIVVTVTVAFFGVYFWITDLVFGRLYTSIMVRAPSAPASTPMVGPCQNTRSSPAFFV